MAVNAGSAGKIVYKHRSGRGGGETKGRGEVADKYKPHTLSSGITPSGEMGVSSLASNACVLDGPGRPPMSSMMFPILSGDRSLREKLGGLSIGEKRFCSGRKGLAVRSLSAPPSELLLVGLPSASSSKPPTSKKAMDRGEEMSGGKRPPTSAKEAGRE